MIDAVQVVLLVVIILLAVLLIVLGIQVFIVLREVRSAILRAKNILEKTEQLSDNVSQPFSFISSALFSSKTLSVISKLFKSKDKKNE